MGKGTKVSPPPAATGSTISLQHKAALQAVFLVATGGIWSNKREREREREIHIFLPIPADKSVLFQKLMSFLLEKCENLDWLKETSHHLPVFFFVFEAHSRSPFIKTRQGNKINSED